MKWDDGWLTGIAKSRAVLMTAVVSDACHLVRGRAYYCCIIESGAAALKSSEHRGQ